MHFEGSWNKETKAKLREFANRLEDAPWGGPVEGYVVLAGANPRGMVEAMRPALKRWMRPAAFKDWDRARAHRPVATGGKTFVGQGGDITSVVCPMPDTPMLLAIAGHELVEMAHLRSSIDTGRQPSTVPRQFLGSLLFEEFATERVRLSVSRDLDWPPCPLWDDGVGLVGMADDIESQLPSIRYNPPGNDFWSWWQHFAQVWAMACGRRPHSRGAAEALRTWADHSVAADLGWAPVETALNELWDDEDDSILAGDLPAERIWDPIEQYGRDLWDLGVAG